MKNTVFNPFIINLVWNFILSIQWNIGTKVLGNIWIGEHIGTEENVPGNIGMTPRGWLATNKLLIGSSRHKHYQHVVVVWK